LADYAISMTLDDKKTHDLATSVPFADVQRPRDAATLIIIRRDGPVPRVLLGQRHASHKFMPNKFVFPGGRIDPTDSRMSFASDLHPDVLAKLTNRMRGIPNPARARGLALAAVRETFEEVGLIAGVKHIPSRRIPSGWSSFTETGYLPDLSSLRFVARAITPPGRTRRFDSRFFVADAAAIANLDRPIHAGSGELLTPRWFSFDETRSLDLPYITGYVLSKLRPVIEGGGWPRPDHPIPFQYQRHGKWVEDIL
jgi:8-oxo-dGTP pyrophosphatase MutT (NUDIX family)